MRQVYQHPDSTFTAVLLGNMAFAVSAHDDLATAQKAARSADPRAAYSPFHPYNDDLLVWQEAEPVAPGRWYVATITADLPFTITGGLKGGYFVGDTCWVRRYDATRAEVFQGHVKRGAQLVDRDTAGHYLHLTGPVDDLTADRLNGLYQQSLQQ